MNKRLLTDEEVNAVVDNWYGENRFSGTANLPELRRTIAEAQDKKSCEWIIAEIEKRFEDVTGRGSVEQILAIPKYKWRTLKSRIEGE